LAAHLGHVDAHRPFDAASDATAMRFADQRSAAPNHFAAPNRFAAAKPDFGAARPSADRPAAPPAAAPADDQGWQWSGSERWSGHARPAATNSEARPPSASGPATETPPDSAAPQVVGTWGSRYLIAGDRRALWLIDRLAARRALIATALERARRDGRGQAQRLLFPEVVQADERACAAVTEDAAIAAIGFELRRAGPRAIGVHAVPRLLAGVAPEQLVTELLRSAPLGDGPDLTRLATLAAARDDKSPLDAHAAAQLLAQLEAHGLLADPPNAVVRRRIAGVELGAGPYDGPQR
jgi:DNA mismatch repair ATPase MutL